MAVQRALRVGVGPVPVLHVGAAPLADLLDIPRAGAAVNVIGLLHQLGKLPLPIPMSSTV